MRHLVNLNRKNVTYDRFKSEVYRMKASVQNYEAMDAIVRRFHELYRRRCRFRHGRIQGQEELNLMCGEFLE